MTTVTDHSVEVSILDRTYAVKCKAENADQLQATASYLDEQMRRVRQSTSLNNTERVAVVAALNICHEYMQLKNGTVTSASSVQSEIDNLAQRIEAFIGATESVETADVS